MAKEHVGFEEIEKYLEGRDPQKYIVSIEASYRDDFVYLIINDPETGKRIEKHKFTPFVWVKEEVFDHLYGGKKRAIREARFKHGIKLKKLRVTDGDGNTPTRLANGYKYMAKCKDGDYSKLINFFKYGGVDMFSQDYKKLFVAFAPAEQFLIQTGKRLFKGMDDYNDVHRFQFDLETEGLDPTVNAIFQIGIRDNRGYEKILEAVGDTPAERRESEKQIIREFFKIIVEILPDIITAYNSENFDWPFFEERCERLGMDITDIAQTLNPGKKLYRRDSQVKLGGETEFYKQTNMWGFNILDISHAVRRAQAINSNIKKWGLKYITEYSGVAKKNRVYVPGDIINKTWADTGMFYFNDTDGEWFKYNKDHDHQVKKIASGDFKEVKGDFIVQRYLLDDLWETEQIDGIYNQASYLIAKLLSTSYMRSSTMGTAGQWKLIMAGWSYENELGIPDLQKKREFTGGLSRLLEVGYAKNVIKLDFAALYPKIELTHGVFPSLDISGVMEGLLTYIVDKRDEFKFLTGKHKSRAKELAKNLEEQIDTLDAETIAKVEKAIKKNKKLASDYDKKQLPLKILANSFFGAYGAPYIFNWGDSDCAEETTCRGRQYLRLMVKHFTEKHGFRPLVGDTDGFNFAIPDSVNDVKYICKASHWKTEHLTAGQEVTGLEAVLAEFNEEYMMGRMGLDIDDVCESTINFARKNYANLIDGKVKLVGNSIKSKAMPVYIEEFINEGIDLLLHGNGYEFIQLYQKNVDDIFDYKIPVAKIASKSKVKMTADNYKNVYAKQKNKAGGAKARQAHMELIIKHDLKVDLGNVIYYVNTGTAKSHSDIKKVTDKETGKIDVLFNCKLIPQEQLDKNPDYTTDEYNIAKYLDAFNKRVRPLLVCFDPEIRKDILIGLEKDKKTKVVKLVERNIFTESECKLIAGKPYNESDQDTYEALMTMEDKEIRFWDDVDKVPNNMEDNEWAEVRLDWKNRLEEFRVQSILSEKELLHEITMRLEVGDLTAIKVDGHIPSEVTTLCELSQNVGGTYDLKSKIWGVKLDTFDSLFEFEDDAKLRQYYYNSIEEDTDMDRFDMWIEYKNMLEETGETFGIPPTEDTIIEMTDEEKCTLGECGGCEHCDGMGNKDVQMLECIMGNGWVESYNDTWIPPGADGNHVRGLSIKEAYDSIMKQEEEVLRAKSQTKEDTVLDIPQAEDYEDYGF